MEGVVEFYVVFFVVEVVFFVWFGEEFVWFVCCIECCFYGFELGEWGVLVVFVVD